MTVIGITSGATRGAIPGPTRQSVKTWIILRNVPRTATPADIRRACAKVNVDSVETTPINYFRFLPDGKAWVQLTSSNFTGATVKALKNIVIGGLHVRPSPSFPPDSLLPKRARGIKGRAEAAERGLVTGEGPQGGMTGSGKNVVVWGLPGKLTPESLKEYLKGFKLAGTENGNKEVMKLDPGVFKKVAFSSRHIVRTASVSEAHRLVRTVHMTFYRPEVYETKYQIRARVVY